MAHREPSYAYCERLARREAGNFYHAFQILPRSQRRAMSALYAYMRVTDDLADAMTLTGSPERIRERIDAYGEAGLDTVGLNPSPPGVFFPLYEGHFPEGTAFPEFSFPGYLGVIERTLALEGGPDARGD